MRWPSGKKTPTWFAAGEDRPPIHPKAMPVILTMPEKMDTWLSAPWEVAKELQRPLPNAELRIVAIGFRQEALASRAAMG